MFAPQIKTNPMETLIYHIAQHADINEDEARKALFAVTTHVKQKFPLLHSIVDLILETKGMSLVNEKLSSPDFGNDQFLYN
jgi:hypothetical protein